MHRSDLIEYLNEEMCVPSDFDEESESDGGQIFVNLLLGRECFIPNDEIISDLAVVLILRVLNVDPPEDLDDFYNATSPEIDRILRNWGNRD